MNDDELIQRWEVDQERRGLRPQTVRRRRDVVRNFVNHRPGLLTAEPADIHAWLEAVPRVARTRYAYVSCLHAFYCWANTEGHTEANPAAKVRRPRLTPNLPRPIAVADLQFAVGQAPPRERAWLLLAALAGLRCGEIAGLDREHVWDHEDPPTLFVADGKGGRQRAVPLHPEVMAALRVAGLPRNGPVFRSSTGRRFAGHDVSARGNRYLRSIGVQATMHQLRHRFGTDFYRQSRDLRLTQTVLGHASPVTTAVYTAVSPGDAAAVVQALSV